MIFNKLLDTPQIGILYFFFKVANRDQKANDVLRILLRQILEQLREPPAEVYAQYNKCQNSLHKSALTRRVYTTLFICCVEEFFNRYSNGVFILLDAYDEFKPEKEEERQREELLSSLREISSTGSTRLLITTRPQYGNVLQNKFKEVEVVEITTDHEDVEIYLNREMEHIPLNSFLKNDIKNAILSEAKELL